MKKTALYNNNNNNKESRCNSFTICGSNFLYLTNKS